VAVADPLDEAVQRGFGAGLRFGKLAKLVPDVPLILCQRGHNLDSGRDEIGRRVDLGAQFGDLFVIPSGQRRCAW